MTHLPSGRRRRLLVVAAAFLVTAATPHVASSADTSPANSPAGATRTADNVAASVVTLVTGDKVTVAPGVGDGPGTITVQGPDGEPTGARVLTVGGDTYVYPDSARPYLASGTLDDRLFDISRLVADGYDDAALKHLPLIVTYGGKEASASTLRSRAVALPGDVTDVHPLTSVNGVALAADREDTDALWSALACGATQRPDSRPRSRNGPTPHKPFVAPAHRTGPGLFPELRRLGDSERSPCDGLAPPTPTSGQVNGVDAAGGREGAERRRSWRR
ncbi:hypothetical protein ACFY1B_51090, partial [Streptomyces mirabilis]